MSANDFKNTWIITMQSDACPRRHDVAALSGGVRQRLFGSSFRTIVLALLLASFGSLLTGCGGGGGGSHFNPNPNPNPNGSLSLVSGTTTDSRGAPIVGATVTLNGQTVTSTQLGTYAIPDVPVPAGQTSVVGNVQATKIIAGQPWSGQNMVEVLSGEPDTSNVQIVMSPSATQNVISGTVTDTSGHFLRGARVFARLANISNPNSSHPNTFTDLSSVTTATDQNGAYTLAHLPPATNYTLTASFAGFLNQTFANVAVNAPPAGPTVQPFQLATTSTSPTPAVPTGLFAMSITTPAVPTRAVGEAASARAYNAIKAWIYSNRGIRARHVAAATRITIKRTPTRATPAGAIIEADILWDYVNINNLFGYEIAQATNLNPPNFTSIALVRDPLADRFSDVDTGLTPDTTYYYSLGRLDTINFPNGDVNAGESAPADPPVAVRPLGVIRQVAPASGAVTTSTPTFSWTAVNRAAIYQVLIYDRFPDLQSDTDFLNGVQPIWPAPPVSAPTTSQTYSGPALISGHTYFWAVLAQDDVASAFSVSPIQTFVAP